MTINEAIEQLKNLEKCEIYLWSKDIQAIDIAVKALEENKRMKELLKQAVEDFKTAYVLGYNCYTVDCEICPYREYVKEEEHSYCSCGRWSYADEAMKLIGGDLNER